jgi:hypothetical protein
MTEEFIKSLDNKLASHTSIRISKHGVSTTLSDWNSILKLLIEEEIKGNKISLDDSILNRVIIDTGVDMCKALDEFYTRE